MSKNDYDSILKEVEESKVNRKIDFFVTNLFKDSSTDKIAKICYDFEKIRFNYKQVIYKENDEAHDIYLLYQGSIKVFIIFFCNKNILQLTKEYTFMEPRKSLENKKDIISFMRSTLKERTIVT